VSADGLRKRKEKPGHIFRRKGAALSYCIQRLGEGAETHVGKGKKIAEKRGKEKEQDQGP